MESEKLAGTRTPPVRRRDADALESPTAFARARSAAELSRRRSQPRFHADDAVSFAVAKFGWTSDEVYILDIAVALLNRSGSGAVRGLVYLLRRDLIDWLGRSESSVKRALGRLRETGVLVEYAPSSYGKLTTVGYVVATLHSRNSAGVYSPVPLPVRRRSGSAKSRG